MTTTLDDRLRTADPVADLDVRPPDELLERIVAAPRARPPRRLLVPAVVVAAGVAAAVLVLDTPTPGPDLAARAYAATSDGERILYSRVRTEQRFEIEGAAPRVDVGTEEQWLYGDRAHSIVNIPADGWTSHNILRADGTLLLIEDSGREEVIRPDDSREARQVTEGARKGFVATFRERYENGKFEAKGTTTFAGRTVRRYVVRDGAGPDLEEYYLDTRTGEPVGSLNRWVTDGAGRDGRPTRGIASTETVVEALDQLAPTPENLERLSR
jgi:hypothetical protein